MMKVKMIPYEKINFSTRKNEKEIYRELMSFVDLSEKRGVFSNKFYGWVEKNNFSIYKSSFVFNSTLVKVNGDFKENEEGNSNVNIVFVIAEEVFVFLILLELIFGGALAFAIYSMEPLLFILIPLLAMVGVYSFILVPFWIVQFGAKEFLLKKLRII